MPLAEVYSFSSSLHQQSTYNSNLSVHSLTPIWLCDRITFVQSPNANTGYSSSQNFGNSNHNTCVTRGITLNRYILGTNSWRNWRDRDADLYSRATSCHLFLHSNICDAIRQNRLKSVQRKSIFFFFVTDCIHHFQSYLQQQTPLELIYWYQRDG